MNGAKAEDREKQVFEILREVLARFEISLRISQLNPKRQRKSLETPRMHGGLAVFHGKKVMVLDRHLSWKEKNRILLHELSHLNLDGCYLPPLIREKLTCP